MHAISEVDHAGQSFRYSTLFAQILVAGPKKMRKEMDSMSNRGRWFVFILVSIAVVLAGQDRGRARQLRQLSAGQQLTNGELSVTTDEQNGSYQIRSHGRVVLNAHVSEQVDHRWVRSSNYPRCRSAKSPFGDQLGSGDAVTVTCSGLTNQPDVIYVLQLYDQHRFGAIQVKVQNNTEKELAVQAISGMEAEFSGADLLSLGAHASSDRVLSDSFSEDWPDLSIYDLGTAPSGMHRAAGSQLIYNRESQQSFFIGALTSDRFLTLMHLKAEGTGTAAKIVAFSAESAGTTEIQKDFALRNSLSKDQIELSLPLKPGESMLSERLMFAAGGDYHDQLLEYGKAIQLLHHARVPIQTPIGWWSWTAFYGAINEGETLANADWLAGHLKSLGYRFFQVDEGYQYARGEYTSTNATQFPDGMRFVGQHITQDGLTVGVWTAPFEVSSRAWVYEHHQDWLVHNASGQPIPIGQVWNQNTDVLYALDTTHPGAQEYMRETYEKLVREWGIRFIKLDFMDTTAIEGYRYRPYTTALEAQRIGLQIIRESVGNEVLLDKDGSPMLNAVGLVDTGRVSVDTGHSFLRTKNAAPGIAARFYMHRHFFVNDPDAFNVAQNSLVQGRNIQPMLPLNEAQASIALSAVSGGMYEIGDDMLTLGSEHDRLALVENQDLLNMAKAGRVSEPVDLMSYLPEDEQPSIFFLRESPRQAILTIFNWTNKARSHDLKFAELGLPAGHVFTARDVLEAKSFQLSGNAVRIDNQIPHSVKVINLLDTSVAATAPVIKAQVPSIARVGETINFRAQTNGDGVPATAYHWDFGDGTSSEDADVSHAYTRPADFHVRLSVEGVEGVPARQTFTVNITGTLKATPNLSENRRFREPTDR